MRIFQTGAESQNTIELTAATSLSISTSEHTGTGSAASFAFNATIADAAQMGASTQVFSGATAGATTVFVKKDIKVTTLPVISGAFTTAADSYFAPITIMTASGVSARVYIYNDAGTLKCFAGYNANATSSSVVDLGVATGTWFRLECKFDTTPADGSETFEVRVNDVSIINDTNITFTGKIVTQVTTFAINHAGSSQAFSLFFDNWSINDSDGSYNNTWVGEEYIVVAVPDGGGSSNPSVGTYASINEIPASLTASSSANRIEINSSSNAGWFSISTGILDDSQHIIKAVTVPGLIREDSAGTSLYNIGLKSSASGREYYANGLYYPDLSYALINGLEGGDATGVRLSPNGTTSQYMLISETDPTTTSAWKVSGTNSLTNAQIGLRNPGGLPRIWASWMAGMVAYSPKPAVPNRGMLIMFW